MENKIILKKPPWLKKRLPPFEDLVKVNPAHPRAKARGFVEGLQNVPFIPRLKSGAFRMGGVKSILDATDEM